MHTTPHVSDLAAPDAAASTAGREPSAFGALVRHHRERRGLTQRQLADLSTISVRALRDLEQGKARRPRGETVRLIADALRLGPRAREALLACAHQGASGRGGEYAPAEPPAAPYPVVGRARETEVLVHELATGAERLVNVVGLSGVGKTWLALEVAQRLHKQGTPVLWHAFPGAAADYLTPAEGDWPALLGDCVRDLYGDGPASASGGIAVLEQLLADRAAVVVLDGAHATAPAVDRLTRLLRQCPGLRLLVTSVRTWGTPGERPFVLSPLPVHAEGPVLEGPAVRVFLDHARRIRPDFTPGPSDLADVAAICAGLDGHPAALAAAASWLTVCGLGALRDTAERDPAVLLDHLAGGDGGRRFKQALRGLADRLPPGHRELLAALHARADGDFTLEDVVTLTGQPLPDCGRTLRDLLVSGTVRAVHTPGRSAFRLLRLVRDCLPGLVASSGAPLTAAA